MKGCGSYSEGRPPEKAPPPIKADIPSRGTREEQALRRLDPDGLHVEIFLDMLLAGLAAVAAHLVAAERHGGVHRLIAIHPHRAGAQAFRDRMRLGDVTRPQAGAEAERGVVGTLDQFVHILERDRGDDGTKDLPPARCACCPGRPRTPSARRRSPSTIHLR